MVFKTIQKIKKYKIINSNLDIKKKKIIIEKIKKLI